MRTTTASSTTTMLGERRGEAHRVSRPALGCAHASLICSQQAGSAGRTYLACLCCLLCGCALQWPADQGCTRGGSCSVQLLTSCFVCMQAGQVDLHRRLCSAYPTPACSECACCRMAVTTRRAGTRSAACSKRRRRLELSRAPQMTFQPQAPLVAKPEPWEAAQRRCVQR